MEYASLCLCGQYLGNRETKFIYKAICLKICKTYKQLRNCLKIKYIRQWQCNFAIFIAAGGALDTSVSDGHTFCRRTFKDKS